MLCMERVFSASSDASFDVLSLSCLFSSVEEHTKFRKVRNLKKIVEPYQFVGRSIPAITEGDDDSLGGGRLGNTVSSNNKL